MLSAWPFIAWTVCLFCAIAIAVRLYNLHHGAYTHTEKWSWVLHIVFLVTSILLSVALVFTIEDDIAWLSVASSVLSASSGLWWHDHSPVDHTELFLNPSPSSSVDSYDGEVNLDTLEPEPLTADELESATAAKND